jgi:phosphohistidine swiveling domain-containing protein
MSFCVRLGPDVDAAQLGKLGGKARSLLRLAAAGLPVPEAFAVTSDLFEALRAGAPALPAALDPGALTAIAGASRALAARPWPEGFRQTLTAMLRAVASQPDARFAVRSSASIEDRSDALAAGLFLSRLDVPRDEVPEALRAVLLSALVPGVVAYLARRGLATDGFGFSVLIHRFVAGDASGVAALDPASREPPAIETHTGDPRAARESLLAALARLAAAHGPVEIEWVATGREVTFLQLRPYRVARQARRAGAAEDPGGWRWDAAHNPLPLSPAQAGLVALVDQTCRTGFRQRVTDGYLFYSPAAAPDAISGAPPAAAPAGREVATTTATEALAALRAVADARLAAPAPTLEEALATFTAIYQPLFGVVQPAARAARNALTAFLRRQGIDPAPHLPALLGAVPSSATERRRHARAFIQASDATALAIARDLYLEAFGDESPGWEVATPTWREAPQALERRLLGPRQRGLPGEESAAFQAAAIELQAALPPAVRDDWARRLAAARAATAVGEDDDALYARAQAHVRYALLREGARLCGTGVLETAQEIFWLPLDRVRADARGDAALSRAEAAGLVGTARAADAEARANPPTLSDRDLDEATGEASALIRGQPGAGGTFIGRVRIARDATPLAADSDREVVVARTILPTELPLIAAAALVIETGGPLDHVAAQARERGIPAVVGALGACARLRDGDQVLVDGDAGLVVKLDG